MLLDRGVKKMAAKTTINRCSRLHAPSLRMKQKRTPEIGERICRDRSALARTQIDRFQNRLVSLTIINEIKSRSLLVESRRLRDACFFIGKLVQQLPTS